MTNVAANARKVFGDFIRIFNEKHGDTTGWALRFDQSDCERLGLTPDEVEGALSLLGRKGLTNHLTDVHHELTDAGVDVCLEPHRLNEYLPRPAP